MNNLFKISIFLLSPILLAHQCKKESANCHKRYTFVNKSPKDVYVTYLENFENMEFPIPSPIYWYPNKIKAHQQAEKAGKECFELLFHEKVMKLYVFDADVIETTPWEEVRERQLYLKKYTLPLDSLRKWNWTIVYP